jgi:DNA-binding NtrC family response regulator
MQRMQTDIVNFTENIGQAGPALQNLNSDRSEAARYRSDWALLGESVAVRQLRSQIQRIAPYFRTALLRGEAGSGKQAVAHAIHVLSPGGKGQFVIGDAAALADSFDCGKTCGRSELLAVAGLDSARGGTVYLTRVDELSFRQQAALLRFVRGCEAARPPVSGPVTRILAGSDRDLRALAAIGQFRQDLYVRLSAVELVVPPLRQRADDLSMLAELLLRRFADQTGQSPKALSLSAVAQLIRRQWLNNLRELESVIAQAAALAESGTIEPHHLLSVAERDSGKPAQATPRPERLQDVIQQHVLEVLTRYGGNKLRAAEVLGISRSTLYRMLGANQASFL